MKLAIGVIRASGGALTDEVRQRAYRLGEEAIAGGPHLDRDVIIRYPLRIFAVVREIIERGIREGYFTAADPVRTHLSPVGSLVFFFATAEFRARLLAEGVVPIAVPGADAYVRHRSWWPAGSPPAPRRPHSTGGPT